MMNEEEIICAAALTTIPQIGPVQAKILADHFGGYSRIFTATKGMLERIPGIGSVRAANIGRVGNFREIKNKLDQLRQANGIALLYTSPEYPQRLKHCDDAPPILYFKGNTNLNQSRTLAVVGTRKPSEHGLWMVQLYLEALRPYAPLIISGLAYGIDHKAHQVALQQGLATIGVMANGLHTVYPGVHASLARDMLGKGGLLTEFPWGTKPDKQNFPRRNRIVAGMCDALLVVETDAKGGSMITAELALGYNRDIFALPGRITDKQSRGCNELILENKARMTVTPDDLIRYMNWNELPSGQTATAPTLFNDRNEAEQQLISLLRQFGTLQIDKLTLLSGLPRHQFHSALLNLELDGLCKRSSGNLFTLLV